MDKMEKLTIDKLMPGNYSSYLQKGKFDINSISKDKYINDDPDINFNSEDLLKTIKKRREKTRAHLVISYNLCCEKIKEADEAGMTDLIFNLPNMIIMSNIYCKNIDIIRYISEKLKKQNLNTYIVSDTKLFITWKFIELNKEILLKNLGK
jgi:hypothetical protein